MNNKHWAGNLLLVVASLAFALLLGEVLIRIIAPQSYLYPRYQHSRLYGHSLIPAMEIVQEMPGKWQFKYTVDEYGHRVPTTPISNRYVLPNIVLLGDSNVFGQGVNDGEEFASVLRQRLVEKASVVNLGVPGYGLAQEIRKFYEFGRLYEPGSVVLVFCGNDPEDNLMNPVTVIRDGRFHFVVDRSMDSWLARIKQFLSTSYVQHSQLYNFLRNFAYNILRHHVLSSNTSGVADEASVAYNVLLEAFAADLRARGITFFVLSVPGDMDNFPLILSKVSELNSRGTLTYIETKQWFDSQKNYATPEGHPWGGRSSPNRG